MLGAETDRPCRRIRIKVLCGMLGSLPPVSFGDGYEFVYDAACVDYDWLVVFDEMPTACERLRCPRERTILCTWEPVSIKSYSKSYTRQFGHLLSNRPYEAEKHPHYRLGRGYFLWFVRDVPKVGAAADKPRLVSAVCSAKQMKHTRHFARYGLVSELAQAIPEMDWYGKGVRPLARKEAALVPYKYHVAVENHIAPHHWTEKFADAILCESLPFYAGDPALTEIFPQECFIPIPIDDPAEAVRIVKAAIANDEYAKRRAAVLEAKRLILSKYNFWAQVVEVIESSDGSRLPPPDSRPPAFIYARRALRRHSLAAALEDAVDRLKRGLCCPRLA